MSTLYEMTNVAAQLYAMFEDDEIDEQTIQDTLESLGVEEKLEDYCKVIRQLSADKDAYKAEKARFAEKQARAERSISRMQNAVLSYMTAKGIVSEKAGNFDVRVRKSEAVIIDDMLALDKQYLRFPAPEVDKTALKKAIKQGEEINGAHIETRNNLQIK